MGSIFQWPLLARFEKLLDSSLLGLRVHLRLVLENKLVHVKLPLAAGVVHVPDLPKHLPLSPALVKYVKRVKISADNWLDGT